MLLVRTRDRPVHFHHSGSPASTTITARAEVAARSSSAENTSIFTAPSSSHTALSTTGAGSATSSAYTVGASACTVSEPNIATTRTSITPITSNTAATAMPTLVRDRHEGLGN